MRFAFQLAGASLAVLVAACASIESAVVPGRSSAADVEAAMGKPTERVARPDGGADLYYSRLPYGRSVHVVTLGPDGIVKSVEQRLVRENIGKIVPGTWTTKEVRGLFGPPGATGRLARQQRTWWEYRFFHDIERRVLWVQFSDDGVVREVLDMIDPEDEKYRDGQDGRG